MRIGCILLLFVIFQQVDVLSQSTHKLLRNGDKAYEGEEYSLAEEHYRKALDERRELKGVFNLGNTVYQQNRYEEAIQHYKDAANYQEAIPSKAGAYYNLGNAQLKNGEIEEAINAYKNALRFDPNDPEALNNLAIAKLIQRKNQEQQNQNNQSDDQDENNQSEEENQDANNSENNQDDQQNSPINNEDLQNEDMSQRQELNREDALKLLQVIENEEKNVQEKLRKAQGNKKKPEKDW